jgi:hypothetical protein
MTNGDFYAEYQAQRLRRQLDDMFRAVLPAHWVDKAVDATLSEACPLVTPAERDAAVKKEIDWQTHWMEKWQREETRANSLERQIDRSRFERVDAVLKLVHNLWPTKTAKHDATCHERHAQCLAARVRELLTGEIE